ncbi:MAG: hypothetical protein K2H52_05445 [Lachnospiraceae bacterium]|nr:hypothetical protein [Lachnospiraceae bacterium]
MDAGLRAVRHGCRLALYASGLKYLAPILLVKSDLKTRLETIGEDAAAAILFCGCPIAPTAPPLRAELL